MSRNFGLGTRDLVQAGRKALARANRQGELSYASVDAIADRWAQFVPYAKSRNVARMEQITPQLVQEYGQRLAGKAQIGEITAAYAQNLLSGVNTVMHQVCRWHSVSPTKDCGIQKRSAVRKDPPASVDLGNFERVMEVLREQGCIRQAVIAELARHFGLRSKEASLIDAKVALRQAKDRDVVTIREGTKGGRARELKIIAPIQIVVLEQAANLQGTDRSLVPTNQTWVQWRNGGLRDGREVLKTHGFTGYHDLRAGYACERYLKLTGHFAPVCGGKILDRKDDCDARQVISLELGHNRIDVVSAYIGGR